MSARKPNEKERALALRREGKSIRAIARQLNISISTASLWCRDVVLTEEQRRALDGVPRHFPQNGRLRALAKNKQLTEERHAKAHTAGVERIHAFDDYHLLLLGLGLYLGDGKKGPGSCMFSGANAALLRLMIKWFERCFAVTRDRFRFRVTVHELYRDDTEAMRAEWLRELELPPESFVSFTFITSKRPPPYSERGTYKGTVSLTVKKSSDLLRQILGMAELLVYKGNTRKPG